ncbi:MAG: hypothetical protein ACRD2N_13775 [Vicinamibacterales bacterium]
MRTWVFAAAVMIAVLAIGWPQLFRPGYSANEEFTVFAVRGIDTTRLPLLPSNLLYDRGLAYSYASWLAGAATGSALPSYRALALVSALAALVLVFTTVQRHGSIAAASIALLLVATSPPLWAAATSARFYAPFLFLYLLALALLERVGRVGRLGTSLFIVSVLCRLCHELAFTLAAIPLLCFVLSQRGNRVRWLTPTLAVVAGLTAAQAGLFALHYLVPSSGDTMIRRFFLWQALNLFETPPNRQFGIALAVLVISWLVAPQRAWLNLVIVLCIVAFILSLSITSEATVSPFSTVLVASLLREGSRYPLDMFWHIVRTMPVTIALAMTLLVARLAGVGGEWRAIERAAHLLWIGWVLWFGVIDSGITISYLLLPIALMLVAIAIDLSAIVAHTIDSSQRLGRAVSWAVCVLAVAAVVTDQWRGEGSIDVRLEAARPTINVDGIDEIRDSLQPGDRVVCTDELGCLMLVGRIDVWLALDDYVRERFIVKKGDGQLVGVYTGKPAVFRPANLFEGQPAARTIVVDVFKDYPVGNTRIWLPRALARDGVEVSPLLETPQARIVQISPPIRHARRQPVD